MPTTGGGADCVREVGTCIPKRWLALGTTGSNLGERDKWSVEMGWAWIEVPIVRVAEQAWEDPFNMEACEGLWIWLTGNELLE